MFGIVLKVFVLLFIAFPALSFAQNVGDVVEFGRYPYNIAKSKEPLKWMVLDNSFSKLTLITVNGIDAADYDSKGHSSWSECGLNKWLNTDFKKKAFTSRESIVAGNVRILNAMEVLRLFKNSKKAMASPTPYALRHGVYANEINGNAEWWIMATGDKGSVVNSYGEVSENTERLHSSKEKKMVRPVIRIQQSSLRPNKKHNERWGTVIYGEEDKDNHWGKPGELKPIINSGSELKKANASGFIAPHYGIAQPARPFKSYSSD